MDLKLESEYAKLPRGGLGQTKIAKHGWVLKDAPGKLQHIAKTRLIVDHDYQRSLSAERVARISRAWSWIACGALVVAERNGLFYVVDGQHRYQAAINRADVDTLPCLVFESEGQEMEARGFYDINMGRKAPSLIDQMRAAAIGGDETVRALHKMLASDGYTFIDKGTHRTMRSVSCPGAFLALARRNMSALTELWPLLVELHRGAAIGDRITRALAWIQANASESIFSAKWHDRICELDPQVLEDACRKASLLLGKGGEAVWGRAALDVINKGRRAKLSIKS